MKHRLYRALIGVAVVLALIQPVAGHNDIIGAVNSYRASYGLPGLTQVALLETVAHQRAVEISTNWTHDANQTERLGCWSWGENIASITTGHLTMEWLIGAWHASPLHRAVLQGNWSQIGAGVYDAPNGRTYVALLVMRPCSPAPTPRPPQPQPPPPSAWPAPAADHLPDANMLGR